MHRAITSPSAEPLGFENTFAMVIRGDDAQRLHLRNAQPGGAATRRSGSSASDTNSSSAPTACPA